MECDVENTDNESNNIRKMWQTLITTLTRIIAKPGAPNFELILNMIRKTITYEDPGLFSIKNYNSLEERVLLEACNTWLFNTLLNCLTDKKFESFVKTYV